MSDVGVVTTSIRAIAGVGERPDAQLRLDILSANPDWKRITKEMCGLEGQGLLMADTVALFLERCDDMSHRLSITSMIGARPPVIRRKDMAN
jgi:hypothetical protein